MIEVNQVTKTYRGQRPVLKDISFNINEGEMVFVTGHSGAGKTTLLRIIGAIERPTSGSLRIKGQDITKMSKLAYPYLRRNFGLVFQDLKLLMDRSVFDNVALPLKISGFQRNQISRRVRAALDKVGLLRREQAMPITLSGGEQQRLCIARAIIDRPAILLADEPTASLDEAYEREIIEMLKDFNQVGVTVIIATHNTSMVKAINGRKISLEKGVLRQ